MRGRSITFALVLAAGDGSRLRSLTTAEDTTVPRQYCSLHGGPSLVEESIRRAGSIAAAANTLVVVAEQHCHWWEPTLAALPRRNLVVQPFNRGTAYGILLPLLHIAQRDPDARVVVLPSDHHVRHEGVLAAALRDAVVQLDHRCSEVLLLGLRPEQPDPELGYIVPGAPDGPILCRVTQFVEKPSAQSASMLFDHGALWNAFILVGRLPALLGLFQRRMPQQLAAMRRAVLAGTDPQARALAVARHYARLAPLDFSRDILVHEVSQLRVLTVAPCGWTDLGTPRRVADMLQVSSPREPVPGYGVPSRLSLAAQHALLQAG